MADLCCTNLWLNCTAYPCVSLLYTTILSVHTADNFTDAAVSNRINGEHKEKDLEPWEGGEPNNSDSLESLDTDVVGVINSCAALDILVKFLCKNFLTLIHHHTFG